MMEVVVTELRDVQTVFRLIQQLQLVQVLPNRSDSDLYSRGQPDALLLGRLQGFRFRPTRLCFLHRRCRRPDEQTQHTISLVR